MNKLKLIEVKNAVLHDQRFRELFPELSEDFIKVLKNPGCGCNMPTYRKVMDYPDRLKKYFPNKEIVSADEAEEQMVPTNNWAVINCKASELENTLNSLHKKGRKQIAIGRWQDEITIVINDLGVVF